MNLQKNEAYYLDKTFMKKGKQDNAQDDVPKAFAHFSGSFMGQQLTNSENKSLRERSPRNQEIWCIYVYVANRLSGKHTKMSSSVCLPNLLSSHC